MSKIVVDVDIENIKDGDLLVYDAKKDKFVSLPKHFYLAQVNQKIQNLNCRDNELFEYITDVDNKLRELIRIYKENLR